MFHIKTLTSIGLLSYDEEHVKLGVIAHRFCYSNVTVLHGQTGPPRRTWL